MDDVTIEQIQEETLDLLMSVEGEVQAIIAELVLPTWGTDGHGWPRTLYGHVMGAFSLLDRISHTAVDGGSQTRRMVRFAVRWLDYEPLSSEVAVHLWRHSLMHTGQPQPLIDSRDGTVWRWLLHWGSHLPREHHMTASLHDHDRILNFALVYFLEDLHAGVERWFDTVRSDLSETQAVVARHARLASFEVTLTSSQ